MAENLLNPFGDDAEDFNVDHIINRNLQASILGDDNKNLGELTKVLYS